ncbi:MAG: FAD-binding protein [Actinomycetota bacterium]
MDSRWPDFEGRLRFDEESRQMAARDFGGIVHRRPSAVLEAASGDDVCRLIRYAAGAGRRIAPRGQGHSAYGQSQAAGGIVLDLGRLDRIHARDGNRMTVDAGARWTDVALAALKEGFLPPVLTDFLGLSVGGTLSVGGLSGMSFRWGAQVDNVESLVVATGRGDVVTCDAGHHAELFSAVLAGLGQCGVILRATLRLEAAPAALRVYRFSYADPPSMLADLRRLSDGGEFDYLLGIVTPNGDGGWNAEIEATASSDGSDEQRLEGLADVVDARRIEERVQETWLRRVEERVAALQAASLWDQPHPWLDLFVPSAAADQLLGDILATPVVHGVGPLRILLYPLRRSRLRQPLLRTPDDERFFLVDVLCTAGPGMADEMVSANRALFERCRELGGTQYPIGAVPMTRADWQVHFGGEWSRLEAAKQAFDPDNILTPGPGIFP